MITRYHPRESRYHVIVVPESLSDHIMQVFQRCNGLVVDVLSFKTKHLISQSRLYIWIRRQVIKQHAHQVWSRVSSGDEQC